MEKSGAPVGYSFSVFEVGAVVEVMVGGVVEGFVLVEVEVDSKSYVG